MSSFELIMIKCFFFVDVQINQLIQLFVYKDFLYYQEVWSVKNVLLVYIVYLIDLKNMCFVFQVYMLMRYYYFSVWNVQQVIFVKIQQNFSFFVKMEYIVQGILLIVLRVFQDLGIDCVLFKVGNFFYSSWYVRVVGRVWEFFLIVIGLIVSY